MPGSLLDIRKYQQRLGIPGIKYDRDFWPVGGFAKATGCRIALRQFELAARVTGIAYYPRMGGFQLRVRSVQASCSRLPGDALLLNAISLRGHSPLPGQRDQV